MAGFSIIPLGTENFLNPGFEGAKCYIYGMSFDGYRDSNHTLFLVNEGSKEQVLEDYQGMLPNDYDSIRWIDPERSLTLVEYYSKEWNDHLQLLVDVESSVPLQGLDKSGARVLGVNSIGDPSGWNDTDPTSVQLVEWWTCVPTKVSESNGETQWVAKKESIALVPADILIHFSIPPQSGSRHLSGWTEGSWTSTTVWFMLDWVNWLNVAKPILAGDLNPPEDLPVTAERIYGDRGGFPITAWVGGWEIIVPTQDGDKYTEFPWSIFYQLKGANDYKMTYEQIKVKYPSIVQKVQIYPSVEGNFKDLYTAPDFSFSYDLPETNDGLVLGQYAQERLPDPRMKYTQYFPITLNTFGVDVEPTNKGWDLLYPYVYYRLRVIYGVYGNFTYLWTTKSSEDVGYPGFKNGSSTIIHVENPFISFASGLGNLLSQPWFWFLLGTVIVIVLVLVFAPQLVTLGVAYMMSRNSRGRR